MKLFTHHAFICFALNENLSVSSMHFSFIIHVIFAVFLLSYASVGGLLSCCMGHEWVALAPRLHEFLGLQTLIMCTAQLPSRCSFYYNY